MIKLQDVKRHYLFREGSVKAVDGVQLEIGSGEFMAVMGPSGSGKSTLLYLLGAMDQPTDGWIEIAGKRLDRMNDTQRSGFRNQEIGFVFQAFHLLPRLTLWRNVELPLMYAGMAPALRRKRAEVLLQAVGLGDKIDRTPLELSGGQCQRAAIARALTTRPRLLLADEPTGNLDSHSGLEVMAIFQALNQAGMTVVMVTHDENMAAHAGRVLRLRDGQVVEDHRSPDPRRASLPPELDIRGLVGGLPA
jgi:putative ABC transport system ATP-binding protein